MDVNQSFSKPVAVFLVILMSIGANTFANQVEMLPAHPEKLKKDLWYRFRVQNMVYSAYGADGKYVFIEKDGQPYFFAAESFNCAQFGINDVWKIKQDELMPYELGMQEIQSRLQKWMEEYKRALQNCPASPKPGLGTGLQQIIEGVTVSIGMLPILMMYLPGNIKASRYEKKIEKIILGIKASEIKTILGEPQWILKSETSDYQIWLYRYPGQSRIVSEMGIRSDILEWIKPNDMELDFWMNQKVCEISDSAVRTANHCDEKPKLEK